MSLNIQKNNFFPINVFHCKIDESYCDEVEAVVARDKESFKKNLRNVRAKTSGWDGYRIPVIREMSHFFCDKILPSIGESMKWEWNNWQPKETWINLYEKGDFTKLHHHHPVDYAAILIVKPGKGNLRFYDPNFFSIVRRPFEPETIETINEERGMAIFFPSFLFHDVSNVQEERITVAFNFFNPLLEDSNTNPLMPDVDAK